jgi:peptide/nickel transport system permease protein
MAEGLQSMQNKNAHAGVEAIDIPKRLHWTLDILVQLVKTKPLGAFGGFIVLVLILVALGASIISPFGPNAIHGQERLIGPNRTYYFGTDNMARDVFSRIMYGARVSLIVGFGAVTLSNFFATLIGVLSGYIGGWFDTLMQRIVDAMMSFPWLIIMLTVMAVLGPGTANVILALAIAGTWGGSRVNYCLGYSGSGECHSGRGFSEFFGFWSSAAGTFLGKDVKR